MSININHVHEEIETLKHEVRQARAETDSLAAQGQFNEALMLLSAAEQRVLTAARFTQQRKW